LCYNFVSRFETVRAIVIGVRVGVARSRNKIALRTKLRNSISLVLIISEITAFTQTDSHG